MDKIQGGSNSAPFFATFSCKNIGGLGKDLHNSNVMVQT